MAPTNKIRVVIFLKYKFLTHYTITNGKYIGNVVFKPLKISAQEPTNASYVLYKQGNLLLKEKKHLEVAKYINTIPGG